MNTRLQVEHPITEAVTGIDLVQWQFRLARGERLAIDDAVASTARGHAIECRVYAEDPDAGFMPSPGTLLRLTPPSGPGIRDDGGYDAGGEVPIFYDSLVSKLVAWAPTREEAIARMRRALAEYEIAGVRTTLPFFRWLLDSPAFLGGEADTTFLDRELAARNGAPFEPADEAASDLAAIAVAVDALFEGRGGSTSGDPRSRWTEVARAEAQR
jgi:acetyl/propionyl-CoA carboxylase alpha subunit